MFIDFLLHNDQSLESLLVLESLSKNLDRN